MVNKKVVVISTIIALIVIAGIVTFAITKSNNYSESTENNIKTIMLQIIQLRIKLKKTR